MLKITEFCLKQSKETVLLNPSLSNAALAQMFSKCKHLEKWSVHVLSSEFYRSVSSLLQDGQKLSSFKSNNLVLSSSDDTRCLSVLSKMPGLKKLKLLNVLNPDL